MPLQQMEKSFGPLEESLLTSYELSWDIRLPDEYRQFLLTYNGGRPIPCEFNFKGQDSGSAIDGFLGLGGGKNYDLLKTIKLFQGRLPARFFPVACDQGGNQICLSVSGPDSGKVYFWNHEFEADERYGDNPETADNITLIADSFNEFLNGLF